MGYRWVLSGALAWALAIGALVVPAGPAAAAEWDTIAPGRSTAEQVRAQLGEPSKKTTQKVEGYDTTEWMYEGDRAPRGIRRLVVELGILTPQGFRPDTVRVLRLEPVPGVFNRRSVLVGWGEPTGVGNEGDQPTFFYKEGLIVVFEKEGWRAVRLIFMPPQAPPPPPPQK